jgi:hypothetical protein
LVDTHVVPTGQKMISDSQMFYFSARAYTIGAENLYIFTFCMNF